MQRFFLLFSFLVVFTALLFQYCSVDHSTAPQLNALQEKANGFSEPLPAHAFAPDVPASDALLLLGKMLYHEPRISKSGVISCSSCHSLATFGVDQTPVSIGHGWQQGPLNAPTVLNAALHRTQFWNGRAADVEAQALLPILDPLEMASSEAHVVEVLSSIPAYVDLFHQAFPEHDEPLVYAHVGTAIGAFERTLLTPSPYDAFLKGDAKALSEMQQQGLEVFIEAGCQACHSGAAMGGNIFVHFITPAERASGKANPGRFEVSGRQADKHFFKVPSLRNVVHTYPYLHDGSIWDLGETVSLVAREMTGRELTANQVEQILAFLESLTGEIPADALVLPVLPASTALTPRPDFN